MPHPKRKVYRAGSPGFRRAGQGTTLNALKTAIRLAASRSKARRAYVQQGLLGNRGDALDVQGAAAEQ